MNLQPKKLTLKELMEQNKLKASGISLPSEVSKTEKIAPSQSLQERLKNQLNTNIRVNTENAPKTQESALTGILQNKLLVIPNNSVKNPPITLPSNTTLSSKLTLKEMLEAKKKELSLEDRLALAKHTHETLKEELKVSTLEDAKSFNVSPNTYTDSREVPIEDASKVKEKAYSNLLSKLNKIKPLVSNPLIKKDITTEEVGEVLNLVPLEETTNIVSKKHETFSLDIVLNERQQAAVSFAESGKSFVLLGAAGTGKTSSEGAILHKLLESDTIGETSFKLSGEARVTAPSVAVVAYTRRAAANSAKAILKDPLLRERLNHNIMTIHALLEFIPETYIDVADNNKEKFRFVPTRTRDNPLTITHIIIEEATLVGLDLWELLYEALPYDVHIIFVGDINQLPPVFGPSILNYALTKIPVIELTQVYRQAEGSPIINNAHRILKGEMLQEGSNEQGKLVIVSGKNNTKVGQAKTAAALANMFKQYYEMGLYNPDEDIILSPWNKKELGTDALNIIVTEFLSVKNNTLVYEVIAGFKKLYLAEGDKVIYNKRDAIIVGIERNNAYVGKEPALPGTDLSRYGVRRMGAEHAHLLDEEDLSMSEGDMDYSNFSIEEMEDTAMERKMQCSHRITIAYETGFTETISAAGELAGSGFQLGYAMTVHKSQGSEWRRVFIVFHPDHAISLSREMLYTAITRAREEVYLIAKRYVLDKAVISQRVKGNTLEDKIAIFNSGTKEMNLHNVRVTKPSLHAVDDQ